MDIQNKLAASMDQILWRTDWVAAAWLYVCLAWACGKHILDCGVAMIMTTEWWNCRFLEH